MRDRLAMESAGLSDGAFAEELGFPRIARGWAESRPYDQGGPELGFLRTPGKEAQVYCIS